MAFIYKIKENVHAKDFLELENGFCVSKDGKELIKIVHQPLGGKAANFLLTTLYNNEGWKNAHYCKNKRFFKKYYDLKYDKSGNIIITERMKEILETWYLYINFEDGWVGFKSSDELISMVYYGKKILDDYCPREIFTLLSHNLIQQVNVD